MNDNDILFTLFRTTLVLTLCGGICFLALRKIEHRLPKLSRLLWVAVLLTGWCWLQPVIQIPTTYFAGTPAFNDPPTMVGSRPPGGYVGDSRQEWETAKHDMDVAQSAEYRTLPPGGRQPTYSETNNQVPAQERGGASPPVTTYILPLWLTGMFITILLSAVEYIRILYRLRYTEPAEDALAEPWRKLLTEHGIDSRTVPMLMSQNFGPALVRTPLGYRFVVPNELWSELSELGRQGIFKHELAHFRRRDVWKSFFVRILALPHWFNPVAHYAANRFDELAEQLCDREAFAGKREDISEFARILLLLHENAPTHFVARQSIFGRNLERRVASLLENPLPERTFTMRKTLLVLGTAVILFAALFRVEFVAQEPTREPATVSPQSPQRAASEAGTPAQLAGPNPEVALRSTSGSLEKTQDIDLRIKLTLPEGLSPETLSFIVHVRMERLQPYPPVVYNLSFDQNGQPIWKFLYSFDQDGKKVEAKSDEQNEPPAVKPGSNVAIQSMGYRENWWLPFINYDVVDKPVQEIELAVRKAFPVLLRLTDENSGEPISGMNVIFFRESEEERDSGGNVSRTRTRYFMQSTNQQGETRFHVIGEQTQLEMGYSFKESSELHDRYHPTLTLDPEKKGEQKFEIKLPTPFTIRLLRVDGTPTINGTVTFRNPNYRPEADLPHSEWKRTTISRGGEHQFWERPDAAVIMAYDNIPISPGDPDSAIEFQNIIYELNDKSPPGNELVLQLQKGCQVQFRFVDKETGQRIDSLRYQIKVAGQTIPLQRELATGDHYLVGNLSSNVKYTLEAFLLQEKGKKELFVREFQFDAPGETLDLGDLEVDVPKEP